MAKDAFYLTPRREFKYFDDGISFKEIANYVR